MRTRFSGIQGLSWLRGLEYGEIGFDWDGDFDSSLDGLYDYLAQHGKSPLDVNSCIHSEAGMPLRWVGVATARARIQLFGVREGIVALLPVGGAGLERASAPEGDLTGLNALAD